MMFKGQYKKSAMVISRIVSFLPSCTELIYELGEGQKIKAVTHECQFPSDAKNKPKVISSVFNPDNISSKQIDQITAKIMKEGKDIFVLDEDVLRNANPDLVISQTTCEVCAAHTRLVEKAISILERKPKIVSLNPHTINDIIKDISKIAVLLGKKERRGVLQTKIIQRVNKF